MEFSVGKNQYRSRRLDAFKQLFVVKRIAGVLDKDLVSALVTQAIAPSAEPDLMAHFAAFTKTVKNLSDQDLEFIVTTCCEACQRGTGRDWFPIVANGRYMYDDITAIGYLTISYRVLSEDLGNFFEELRSIWETDPAPTESQSP